MAKRYTNKIWEQKMKFYYGEGISKIKRKTDNPARMNDQNNKLKNRSSQPKEEKLIINKRIGYQTIKQLKSNIPELSVE